jgi:hypothetical protein
LGTTGPAPIVKDFKPVRASPTLIAATATIVFIGTLGLLLVVAGFGVIRVVEDMGEGLGFVPSRWGEGNLLLMVEIAAAISLPIVIWSSVWFFRKSREAEIKMLAQETAKP